MTYGSPYQTTFVLDRRPDTYSIASLLLDTLDLWPPAAGDWCVMYLLYHPSDARAHWFSSEMAAGEVCQQIIRSYEDENELLIECGAADDKVLGWRFVLEPTPVANILTLRHSSPAPASTIELVFAETDEEVRPDQVGLTLRSQSPLQDDEELIAVVEAIDPSLRIGRHVDRFQRSLWWNYCRLYLTKERNGFHMGPHPACDLLSGASVGTLAVTFKPDKQEWEVGVVTKGDARQQPSPDSATLSIESGGRLLLKGKPLRSRPTFGKQIKERWVPAYDLAIMSRLLPVGPQHGYGYVAKELTRRFGPSVQSSIRLYAEGDYLYSLTDREVYMLVRGQPFPEGVYQGAPKVIDGQVLAWQFFTDELDPELRGHFVGQLVFQNHPTIRLAGGAFTALLKEVFLDWQDEVQKDARLGSLDGVRFQLKTSERPGINSIWVKPSKDDRFKQLGDGQGEWTITGVTAEEGAYAEFIVGSTRYCLTAPPYSSYLAQTGGS